MVEPPNTSFLLLPPFFLEVMSISSLHFSPLSPPNRFESLYKERLGDDKMKTWKFWRRRNISKSESNLVLESTKPDFEKSDEALTFPIVFPWEDPDELNDPNSIWFNKN